MNTYPFSIFKRADRSCYSVSFKDANGKYLRPVSTGKKNEADAIQSAFKMLRDGIPLNQTVVATQDENLHLASQPCDSAFGSVTIPKLRVHDLSLKNMIRQINTGKEAEIILSEMKRLGWVKSFVLSNTPEAVDFVSFLKTFWDWDTSPYIKEKLRKSHGIHKLHCIKQLQGITRYWEPFFKGRYLGDITAVDIDAFITHMGDEICRFHQAGKMLL